MRPLSEHEALAFLEAARSCGVRFEALYVLAAITMGMRRGELLGVRWDDVDLHRDTLRVGRPLVREGGGTSWARPRPGGAGGRSTSRRDGECA